MNWAFLVVTVALFLTGIALIVFAVKRIEKGLLRNFLLTAGASLTGLPIFALLHNLLYGSSIYPFVMGFRGRLSMAEEPVFFLLATLVCPLGFFVGTIGSAVIALKRSAAKP
ncbi:MAG: hypothetical protein A2Y59_00370 [Chloroflexi bacterium RBG_13_52_14]|nr:MAG: hypothetical protein A2Y59_00370 [Chloroflexi bacterium RBG_13_52_14]